MTGKIIILILEYIFYVLLLHVPILLLCCLPQCNQRATKCAAFTLVKPLADAQGALPKRRGMCDLSEPVTRGGELEKGIERM